MKPLDWIIVAILVLSVVQGLRRGFIVSVISLIGFAAGFFVAGRYWTAALPVVKVFCSTIWLRQLVSFLLVLFLVWLVFAIIARLLRSSVSAIGLGGLDRLLGGVFGLLRGMFVVVIGFIIAAAAMPQLLQPNNSRLAPYFLSAAQTLLRGAPSAAAGRISSGLRRENDNSQ